jgi:hypothetical protein
LNEYFSAIFKDNVVINCIIFNTKGVHFY